MFLILVLLLYMRAMLGAQQSYGLHTQPRMYSKCPCEAWLNKGARHMVASSLFLMSDILSAKTISHQDDSQCPPPPILSGQQGEGRYASASRLVRSLWPPDMVCRRQMR